jgi:uncharacterized radical SAM superfamily protein
MGKFNKEIEELILSGALEAAGIDAETGEPLYSFTTKLKAVSPELYKEHLDFVNAEIMGLWEQGFVEIDLLSENPVVKLTNKSLNSDEVNKLSKQQKWSLLEIKRVMDSRSEF